MAHTLLLADDSVTIQRVIELTFADEDVRVVSVSDGDEAIAFLDRTPPDIVLADVGMPGRSGYDVAHHVKQTPTLSHIPVVLLTGAFEPVDQERASAAGYDGVLAKPFEPQLVIGRVRELLARPKEAAASSFWAAPPHDPAHEPPRKRIPLPADDDYFARLDEAFATLSQAPEPAAQERTAPAEPLPAHAIAGAQMPVTYASSQNAFDRSDDSSAWPQVPEPARTTVRQPMASGPALPALADAFTTWLAAEEAAPPSDAPAWPAGAPVSVPITDDLIEQVAATVLARISDRVVRDTARELVSAVAERMVREEIERIKANIK